MTSRHRPISAHGIATRAEHARAYLMVAELVRDDDTLPAGNNVVGALSVMAGIAAADAICGHALGRRAAGEAHHEAIAMLDRATPTASKARWGELVVRVSSGSALVAEVRLGNSSPGQARLPTSTD